MKNFLTHGLIILFFFLIIIFFFFYNVVGFAIQQLESPQCVFPILVPPPPSPPFPIL